MPENLSQAAHDHLTTRASPVYVSIASIWELNIKKQKNLLRFDATFAEMLSQNHFKLLPITIEHTEQATSLPPIHRDPFDRMLIGQALCEKLTLVTRDQEMLAYDVPAIRA